MIIMDYLQSADGNTEGDLESKTFTACKGMRYLNLKRNQRGMGKVVRNAILEQIKSDSQNVGSGIGES